MNALTSPEKIKEMVVSYARSSDDRLTFILGAGAALGYSRTPGFRALPPIVSQLFDSSNPLVHTVIENPKHVAVKGQRAHIQRSIAGHGGDLEAYLSDLYENDTEDDLFPYILQYLEDIFTEASLRIDIEDNHFQALLNRIRDLRGSKKWSIVNFNYDTLLEQSIENLPRFVPPRTFATDTNYLEPNPKVLKMHGGVNMRYISVIDPERQGRPSSHEVFSAMMNDSRPVESYLEISNMRAGVPDQIGHRTYKDIGGRSIMNFPLMMIPIHTSVKCPNSFFSRQLEAAKKDISESKLVVAIGYQFGDNSFIDSLKEIDLKDTKLILVGAKSLLEEADNSRAYKQASKIWPKENIHIYDGIGFGNFTDSLY